MSLSLQAWCYWPPNCLQASKNPVRYVFEPIVTNSVRECEDIRHVLMTEIDEKNANFEVKCSGIEGKYGILELKIKFDNRTVLEPY